MLLAGAGVAAVAVAFSPAGSAIGGLILPEPAGRSNAPSGPRPIRVPPTPDQPNPPQPAVPAPAGPTLSDAQLAAAGDIVSADPFLKGLTRGNRFSLVESVAWTEMGSDEVIGADLTLQLASPLRAEAALPGIRYDEQGRSYARLRVNARMENVTALHVLVDFRTNDVVSVSPDANATVTELPGNVHYPAPRED